LIHGHKWYEEKNIDVILKAIVERIDIENNRIRLDDGREVEYDKLLLANGSSPFIPPVTGKYKDGVFALRSLRDLKHIQKYFSLCDDIAIIGGGLLGLEAAWAIKELGKSINVVEFSHQLLPRQLDEEFSAVLAQMLEREGIKLYLGVVTEEILGESRAEGIKIKDGDEFKTDGILFSAGIRPNLELIRNTVIEFDKGVKVNNNMRTNINNIYAAGDVAEFDGSIVGLWGIASDQGKVAGENMTGREKEYKLPNPFTSLTIGNISLFSVVI